MRTVRNSRNYHRQSPHEGEPDSTRAASAEYDQADERGIEELLRNTMIRRPRQALCRQAGRGRRRLLTL